MSEALRVGRPMPDFTYDTPFEAHCRWSEAVARAKATALVFLRYYGCPICQLDMRDMSGSYHEVTAAGGQFLVVLQSQPETLREQIGPDTFPFSLVCDPQGALYQRFNVGKASSMAGLAGAKTAGKLLRATTMGIRHGAYEGDELQLPATIVTDRQGSITFLHYGKQAGDIQPPNGLVQLLQRAAQQ